jgi:putative ABC transport system substrate-binding protein
MIMKSKFWFVFTVVLMSAGPVRAADIVLVLSSDSPDCRAVAAGFKNAFSGDLREYNLEGSDERQRKVGEELKAAKPAVAVVVGDLAAQMAKWYLADVPVVYCDSVRAAKLSLTSGPASGIYHEPDPSEQLRMLHDLFPGKTRVGLVYCPEYTDIDQADIKGQASGMGVTLEVQSMKSIKEVPDKLKSLIPRVDLLWVCTDPVVLSRHSIQFIVLQAISAGKPIFCGDNGLAHGGATAALVPDLEDAGMKAAREAKAVLSGSDPKPGTIVYPRGKLVLNQKTAALLNISFPGDLVTRADEVIQ